MGAAVEYMSNEDQAEFERQTTWASRTFSVKRPWAMVAFGASFMVAGWVFAAFVEPLAVTTIVAVSAVVCGAIMAAPGIWSWRHRDEALRTIELRNRYTQRYLRKPKWWMLLVPPAAGVVGGVRMAGEGGTWWACIGVGIAAALIVAAGLGIQTWRARTGRMDRPERRSNPKVKVG